MIDRQLIDEKVLDYAKKRVINVRNQFHLLHQGKVENPWAIDLLVSFMNSLDTNVMLGSADEIDTIIEDRARAKVAATQKWADRLMTKGTRKYFDEPTSFHYAGAKFEVVPRIGLEKAVESAASLLAHLDVRLYMESSLLYNEGIRYSNVDELIDDHILQIEPTGIQEANNDLRTAKAEASLLNFMGGLQDVALYAQVACLGIQRIAQETTLMKGLVTTVVKAINTFQRARSHDITKGKVKLEYLPQDVEAFSDTLLPMFYKSEREVFSTRCKNAYGFTGILGPEKLPPRNYTPLLTQLR